MNKRRGFTLIELLVVIAIIGLLSSIVLASLNTARVKGRDTKRVSEMRSIQTAVELYYSTNGHYPIVGNWASFDSPVYQGTPISNPNAANLAAALAPYISSSIADPKSLGGDSGYLYYGTTGTDYCVLIWRTPENMLNFSSSLIPTNRCTLPINSSGDCANGGGHSIYVGGGAYANGC